LQSSASKEEGVGATAELSTYPLWRLRLRREVPRVAFYLLVLWGVVASVRFALFPPAPTVLREASQPLDRQAEGFAVAFARAYLSFDSANPTAYAEGLQPFLGKGGEGDLGVSLPVSGSRSVLAAEAVQEREGPGGIEVYTVLCQTTGEGTVYLTVPVAREADGALGIAGYPAFVGGPEVADWREPFERFPPRENQPARTVIERALRNYLAGAREDLAADLAEGAAVTTPPQQLTLESVQQLRWVPGLRSAVAVVTAVDHQGVRFTLSYELDLVKAGNRWQVKAIQMEPTQR
jgi:hypothetical protein